MRRAICAVHAFSAPGSRSPSSPRGARCDAHAAKHSRELEEQIIHESLKLNDDLLRGTDPSVDTGLRIVKVKP